MATLDTLTILIEADARGLETQLKRGLNSITSFVDQMNSQEVNWQQILAGSLDTAIISGIAATFASAISQIVQFQASALNLNNVATPATQSFASSLGDINGQANQLAQQSGASLSDSTAAFEAFSKAGLDGAAAMAATTDAAGIARDTGQSLSDVVSELVPLFQNWGVTTTSGVTDALTGMVNAAQNGKFTFQELASTISAQGANLAKSTDIKDVAIDLASLSTQSGLTKESIVSSFDAIGSSVTDQLSTMNVLLGGPGSVGVAISSGPNGLITAFTKIKSTLDQYGPAIRNTIGTQMGLATTDVASFSNTSIDNFNKTLSAAQNLDTHLVGLTKDLADHEPPVAKVAVAWNNLISTIATGIASSGALSLVVTVLDDINNALLYMEGMAGKVETALAKVGITGSVIKDVLVGGATGGIVGAVSAGLSDLGGKAIAERLNNPGDLKYAGQNGATKDSTGFAKFDSFAAGFQALQNQLSLYISRSGSESLLDFAKQYAPSSDNNNPTQYAQTIAQQLGVSISTPISQLAGTLQSFAKAVSFAEDRNNPNLANINGGSPTTINMNNTNNFSGTNGSTSGSTGTQIGTMLYQAFLGLTGL